MDRLVELERLALSFPLGGLREAILEVVEKVRREEAGWDSCPTLSIWRRDSIPQWRRIYREAEAQGDDKRAASALWMLKEVLEAEE